MKTCSCFFILFVILVQLANSQEEGVASVVLERACEVYRKPGTYLAYQGDRSFLTCSWNGTDDVESYAWTLNGNLFTDYEITKNETGLQEILIEELGDIHAGRIGCIIRTVDGVTKEAAITLALQGLPVITTSPAEYINGTDVTLTCEHSIINVTNLIWFEDGNSLSGLGRSWVHFNGDENYADSITVNLRKKAGEESERYECMAVSKVKCGSTGRSLTTRKRSDVFELNIKYPIQLRLSTIKSNVALKLNQDFNINCSHAAGDYPSTIKWYKYLEDGTKKPVDEYDPVQVISNGDSSWQLLKIYKAKPYMTGLYACEGSNQYGTDVKNVTIEVEQDLDEHSNIHRMSREDLGVGKRFELMCHDSNIDFDQNVEWFKDDEELLKTNGRYTFSASNLIINSLTRSDEGFYFCRYSDRNHPVKFYSDKFELSVIDFPPKPTNLTILVNETTENSLIITWSYSQDVETVATSVKIVADFSDALDKDKNPDSRVENSIACEEGLCPTQYTLRGLAPGTRYDVHVTSVNKLGESESETVHSTTNIAQQLTDETQNEYVMKLAVGIVAGVFVLMCALGYLFFRRHKTNYKKKVYDKIERELGFTIAKTIRTDGSASNEYEYKSLKFQDTLGEGAFGKVVKAEAPGLKCPNGSQTVAVKMCREENDYDRAELLAEIEILTKLGVHQHVIPLLGVCTKAGRPTCLITQYMADGDLQNYLRTSRASFVGTYPFKPQTNDSFQVNNIHKISNLCTSDDTLTSKDLISFARQIACGMEYVSSQKIVHRDLAARNVLVASKRSLKITDFGLAREMRGVNEEYVMGPNRKVPYRWLAPESFFEKKFTVHSDVWAYGVLLYEILTLGGSPYPRHTIRDIPEMLKQGYRMSPPTNSKPELNQLMTMCWHQAPDTRPSFTEIKNLLDELLGDRPEEYLDCGDPDADILPNLNSNDNKEMQQDSQFRYSFLSTQGDNISSIAAQGYDRIADAHSACNTIVDNHNSFQFSPLLNEIKSNPIPDTYQHLPVMEPSPDTDRKNSAQYINHETGRAPVIVKPQGDFRCGTENFVAQKL